MIDSEVSCLFLSALSHSDELTWLHSSNTNADCRDWDPRKDPRNIVPIAILCHLHLPDVPLPKVLLLFELRGRSQPWKHAYELLLRTSSPGCFQEATIRSNTKDTDSTSLSHRCLNHSISIYVQMLSTLCANVVNFLFRETFALAFSLEEST